jgi:23S rRNA pseudouridine955/2504/2580 synthase
MSAFSTVEVAPEEAAMRLDRWLQRHCPGIGRAAMHKLLRTGQVRVDGRRAAAGLRLAAGQQVRVPPRARAAPPPGPAPPPAPSRDDLESLRARVLYRDDDLIAIDKPAGLAVQGGSGQRRHLDALAAALQFEAPEPPRLVHRLDKDTSGVLVLARHARAAAWLTGLFRKGGVTKTYWAVVVGVPRPASGTVARALAKVGGRGREKMTAMDRGLPAETGYRTIARAGARAAWLALRPRTGRTHQLRVHCLELGTPIAGDGKYAGKDAALELAPGEVTRRLHLHARELVIPMPAGANLRLRAPLPAHMRRTFAALGFDPDSPAAERDP